MGVWQRSPAGIGVALASSCAATATDTLSSSRRRCSSSSLAAPRTSWHQGPLRHPVQEGNVVKDLHSVLELACDRHAHHLAL